MRVPAHFAKDKKYLWLEKEHAIQRFPEELKRSRATVFNYIRSHEAYEKAHHAFQQEISAQRNISYKKRKFLTLRKISPPSQWLKQAEEPKPKKPPEPEQPPREEEEPFQLTSKHLRELARLPPGGQPRILDMVKRDMYSAEVTRASSTAASKHSRSRVLRRWRV